MSTNAQVTDSCVDADGRWTLGIRVVDNGSWSLITGKPAVVRREFPWWKLWCWPGLWRERRRCRRCAARGPVDAMTFTGAGVLFDEGVMLDPRIDGVRLVGPDGDSLEVDWR